MGVRELKAKYGGNPKTSLAFNRAIRAEIPGGAALLDALDLVVRAPKREESAQVMECLRRARAEMADVIAQKYDLEPRFAVGLALDGAVLTDGAVSVR